MRLVLRPAEGLERALKLSPPLPPSSSPSRLLVKGKAGGGRGRSRAEETQTVENE
jgi:hypothetical protein